MYQDVEDCCCSALQLYGSSCWESNLGCRNLWLRQSTDTGIEGESQETDSKCGVSVKEVGTHRYTHTNAQTKKDQLCFMH